MATTQTQQDRILDAAELRQMDFAVRGTALWKAQTAVKEGIEQLEDVAKRYNLTDHPEMRARRGDLLAINNLIAAASSKAQAAMEAGLDTLKNLKPTDRTSAKVAEVKPSNARKIIEALGYEVAEDTYARRDERFRLTKDGEQVVRPQYPDRERPEWMLRISEGTLTDLAIAAQYQARREDGEYAE